MEVPFIADYYTKLCIKIPLDTEAEVRWWVAVGAAVLAGGAGALREVGDRRAAIAAAIAEAGKADIVLVAGKGHEQGQIAGAGEQCRVLPFDDVAVARECAA